MDNKGTYFRILTDGFVVFAGRKADFKELAEKMDEGKTDGSRLPAVIHGTQDKTGAWFSDNPGYTTLIILFAIWAIRDICAMVFG